MHRPTSVNPALANYVLLSRPDELDPDEIDHPSSATYSHPIHGHGPISFPDVLVQNIGSDQFLKIPICYANENVQVAKQVSPSSFTTPIKSPPNKMHTTSAESLSSSHSSFSQSKSEISITTARPTFNAKPMNIPDDMANEPGGARTSVGLRLQGRRVEYVMPGGPAFLTGKIKENDEIMAVDGLSANTFWHRGGF